MTSGELPCSGIVDILTTAYAAVGGKAIRVPATVIAPPGVTVWPPITKAPLSGFAVYQVCCVPGLLCTRRQSDCRTYKCDDTTRVLEWEIQ